MLQALRIFVHTVHGIELKLTETLEDTIFHPQADLSQSCRPEPFIEQRSPVEQSN